mgnify:CR=1 FL=1
MTSAIPAASGGRRAQGARRPSAAARLPESDEPVPSSPRCGVHLSFNTPACSPLRALPPPFLSLQASTTLSKRPVAAGGSATVAARAAISFQRFPGHCRLLCPPRARPPHPTPPPWRPARRRRPHDRGCAGHASGRGARWRWHDVMTRGSNWAALRLRCRPVLHAHPARHALALPPQTVSPRHTLLVHCCCLCPPPVLCTNTQRHKCSFGIDV